MAKKLNIAFDSDLIEAISSDFDLREPNKEALRKLIFTLDGDYDPGVMQVLNLATGVGKTYLMAAFIEYLHRQGFGNVVIVTPGKTVQSKTVQNFTPGSTRYIPGSQTPPDIVTPNDYSAWITRVNGDPQLSFGREVPMLAFIFNIQQLIAPKRLEGDTHGSTRDAMRRKPRKFDENAGVLFDYLRELEDLVVIADESHLYSESAEAFNSALKELDPAATIGLTGSVLPGDNVIYKYPLYKAIQDKFIKTPVLAFRKNGYGEDQISEEQQLRDALQLCKIKQTFYDAYAKQAGKARLNAVSFVVCSDLDHATQISELLRAPEYFGNSLAVLQVDSEHEDEATLKLLERLDEPDSPVRAVVSVNKLKEGWDVKNIAVVVTLRAMASEVLTQQTMGRGLRLPFGQYTGVWQIDQLDIISHQSFKELLETENVLRQFGLEEAVSKAEQSKVTRAIHRAAKSELNKDDPNFKQFVEKSNDDNQEDRTMFEDVLNPETYSASEEDTNDSEKTVGIRSIGKQGFDSYDAYKIETVIIDRNAKYADVAYKFPVTTVKMEQPPIDLSEIDDAVVDAAAKRVTSSGDVLYRKEIVASLEKKLRAVDTESAEIDSIKISVQDASEALIKLVMDMQLVPKTIDTSKYVEHYLIPRFMKNVDFDQWTVKSLDSARIELMEVIKGYIAEVQRATKETPVIHPKEMELQVHMLPIGDKVYDPVDCREQFVKGRTYSGWYKSLFAEESFDSYSGEYELARLLNTSPHIVWWHRLHSYDGAYIHYNARDKYFPDFVAFDDEGVHWIIEGKDKRGRDDEKVQAKRKAAESLVRKLVTLDEYDDQKWGYLIAYEDDIAKSDSWSDLKTFSKPVVNLV